MDKKEVSKLWRNFGVAAAICFVMLLAMNFFLAQRVEKAITEVSEVYMTNMNDQLQQKFSLVIELTMEKIDGVINRTPPESAVYDEELIESLSTSAQVRSFVYLGFLLPDGRLQTIYGDDMEITDNESALDALARNGSIAETGRNSEGERCLLLGRAAAYPTAYGVPSTALVAGISTDYLSSVIFAETEDDLIYSHIIDGDGSYVIRTHLPGSVQENYIDYVRSDMAGISQEEIERYIDGLTRALAERTEYADTFIVNGENQRVCCMPLTENSTWYLVTVMPYGVLDEIITRLDRERMVLMAFVIVVMLAVLLSIFLQYYRLTQRQMRILDEAREEANQANQFKSAFLSSMSHDIRTPMNAIMGMSEIALRRIDDKERVEDCLQKLKLSSKQLLGLINDILDISKIESGKMTLHTEEMSLREEMDDIVGITQPQIKARGQKFDIYIRDIISERVWGDSIRINQILLNLLSNAIKFTPEGGNIEIYLWQEPSALGDEYVRTHIRVDDTGIGMSEEFQQRIFENFERESSDVVHHTTGSGLGMSIVKNVVDLMGGEIGLSSELGKGSSFHISVDLKKAKSHGELRLPEWNVLVIDDNEPLCESAAANLEELGVRAQWALNCADAMRLVMERRERGEDYEFILVDWEMPGMNGVDTIRALREHVGEDFPIYLISAYDWSDIQDQLDSVEIAGFISKPLFVSTLYERLSQYVEDPETAAGPQTPDVADMTGRHILLAEDNDLNWEVAEALLSESHMILDRVENGQLCVEKFQSSEVGYYDAILMDVRMPVMDGYEATRRIRALTREDREIPIIAMTADSFSEDVQRCLECGMNHHLSKPLDFRECMTVLQRFIKK